MIASGTYRVRVSHDNREHHMHAESFYGPAFDAGYQETVLHATGEAVNLLEHAQRCAERCAAEHPGDEGYAVRVVHLVHPDGWPDTDKESEWEEVV